MKPKQKKLCGEGQIWRDTVKRCSCRSKMCGILYY